MTKRSEGSPLLLLSAEERLSARSRRAAAGFVSWRAPKEARWESGGKQPTMAGSGNQHLHEQATKPWRLGAQTGLLSRHCKAEMTQLSGIGHGKSCCCCLP